MAFQVSPGVNISEIDLTTVVPSVATTSGAIAGVFGWGPIGKFSLIDSENTLAARLGKPNNDNYETFFTAANFLSYANRLYVSRAAVTTGTSNTFTVSLRGDQYGIIYSAVTVTSGLGVYGTGISGDSVTVSSSDSSTVVELFNSNSGVVANGFITVANTNSFVDGETVVYTSGANAVVGLSNGASYFVLNSNATGFYVASVYGGSAITLTVGLTQNTHTFTRSGQTRVTFSANAALGNTSSQSNQSVNFFDTKYSFNAVANSSAAATRASYIVKNSDHWDTVSIPSGVEYVAKYVGSIGSSLKVSACDTASQYNSTVDPFSLTVGAVTTNSTVTPGTSGLSIVVNESTANVFITNSATFSTANATTFATAIAAKFIVGDYIEVGNTSINKQKLKIKTIGSVTTTGGNAFFTLTFSEPYRLSTDFTGNTVVRYWEYSNVVDTAPATSDTVLAANSAVVDQVSIVVVDEDGEFSGVPGTVLEVYPNLSRATNAKAGDGTTQYYETVINDFSAYIWAANDRTLAVSANAAAVAASTETTPYTASFVGGRDGINESSSTITHLAAASDLFADATAVDVSLIVAGKAVGTNGTQYANYLIDNVAEVRKDCVVFVSPEKSDTIGAAVLGSEATNVIGFRNNLRATSYAVMDSGYKYQYDKYNDVYRWVPLNGDIAGITARSDNLRDPWYSPAGFSRGQVKNLIKLAWSPNKADRDDLYKKDVNPVTTFPGQGTILFGDKTLLGKPSAFDRINVRRLFIVLEKAIATASNSSLFEFNDEFTRAQFKNIVEPFLRDVQGRRGIYDFRVICDESNNTGQVIDDNRFVGDIYIKPAKSINFIQLNFVAVRSGVEFTEVVGQL